MMMEKMGIECLIGCLRRHSYIVSRLDSILACFLSCVRREMIQRPSPNPRLGKRRMAEVVVIRGRPGTHLEPSDHQAKHVIPSLQVATRPHKGPDYSFISRAD
jgi:hypothetical protein